METELIEMASEKAKEKYRAYRDAVTDHANQREKLVNEGLKRAYRLMGQGHKLIDLELAFRAAGMDEKGRPHIGLARANLETVFCQCDRNSIRMGSSEDAVRKATQRTNALLTYHRIVFPFSWMGVEEADYNAIRSWGLFSSPVPIIPIELRPKGGLSGYHILFEAKWQSIPRKDPMLLKHCYGSLFAVLAEWDMTDLELAVLKSSIAEAV